MAPQQVELIATATDERFRFQNASGDVVILSAFSDNGGPVEYFSMKGPVDGDEPRLKLPYRFFGHWSTYRQERQFVFKSFAPFGNPKGKHAVLTYLQGAPGIGPAIAKAIWREYEEKSVEALRLSHPEVAEAVPRLSLDAAEAASAFFWEHSALEECSIEVGGLLDGRGFPRKLPREVVKRWGNAAPRIIRANAYRLMSFRGVGFKRADALFLELGGNPARLKRQALCAWHSIASDANGDIWFPASVPTRAISLSIGSFDAEPERALRLAMRAGLLSAEYTDGPDGAPDPLGDFQWVAEAEAAYCERCLAAIVDDMRGAGRWPNPRTLADLSEHQREKSAEALAGRLAIIGGGPGTGKTYTVAQIVKAIRFHQGSARVIICAPTGKAAVRCTQAMQAAGLPMRARTIHSTLEPDQIDEEAGGWSFRYNAGNLLPADYVIVDECSMVDARLMLWLLRALPASCNVLLVGDVGQLLPVGAGAPLRDFISAGLPYGELCEIRRNSGSIVEACHTIRRGERFECGGNLEHMQGGEIGGLVRSLADAEGVDPIWQTQVVAATNEKGQKSRVALNLELQAALNPNPKIEAPFRINDKVICTKNSWYQKAEGSIVGEGALVRETESGADEVYVANGEIGEVAGVDGRRMIIGLSAPKRVLLVPFGRHDADETGCNFQLGYAITVHKSQGSEWPLVIVALDDGGAANRVCDRAWLYTAISRASKRCVLWGPLAAAHKAARRDRLDQRKTFLAELLGSSD